VRTLPVVLGLLVLAACADVAEAARTEPVRIVSTTTSSTVTVPTTTSAPTTTTFAPTTIPTPPPTTGCAYETAIRAAFPNDGDWAVSVAWRESRCQPGAVNRAETCAPGGSHAMGLFQMCYPLHAPTFAAAGCNDPLEPSCGIAAAALLYRGSGRSPWRLG
jgi:hypothetical protein